MALSSFAVLESTKNSFDSYIDQFESIEKRLSLPPKLLISYTESLFTQFMIDMIDGELRGDILTKYTNTSASRTPTAILQYVKDNYATLTLPELAAKFGYSESQIARIIKKYTGFTYSHLCHDASYQHRHFSIKKHQLFRRADRRDGGYQESGILLQAL